VCQHGTSVHNVHVNCITHVILRHLLTHLVVYISALCSSLNTKTFFDVLCLVRTTSDKVSYHFHSGRRLFHLYFLDGLPKECCCCLAGSTTCRIGEPPNSEVVEGEERRRNFQWLSKSEPKREGGRCSLLSYRKGEDDGLAKAQGTRRNLAVSEPRLDKRVLRPYTIQCLPYRAVKEGVCRYQGMTVRRVRNCQEEEKCLTSESERPIKGEKSAGGVRDHDEGSKIGGERGYMRYGQRTGQIKAARRYTSTHCLIRKHPFPNTIPPSHKYLLLLKCSKYTALLTIRQVTLYLTTPRITTLQSLRLLAYTTSTLLINASVTTLINLISSARQSYLVRTERLITTLLSSLQQRNYTYRSGIKLDC
jgi:hypothetical protein